MNIFVLIKQVPDTETKIKFNGDKTFIDSSSIKWMINPYDEHAIEQALQVKEANTGSTVTAIRVGSVQEIEVLRKSMGAGVDESILVEAFDNLDSYMTAKAIKGAIEKSNKSADLIFAGKQAIDSDCLQVPQLLAQMMNFPSVSVIVGFEQNGDEFTLKREIEGGSLEIYKTKTPCIVACNKGLNTMRYVPLPGIIKAKKKPLTKYSLSDVGVSENDRRIKYSNFRYPPEKPPGKKIEAMDDGKQQKAVEEVVKLLRSEAKII